MKSKVAYPKRQEVPKGQEGPILPPGTIGGAALGIVTASMCFLACLAFGTALLVNHATDHWLIQAGSAVTVQIIESHPQTAQEQLPPVLKILTQTSAIAHAKVIPSAYVIEMLEPWLGTGNVTTDLPLPILIDVQLDPLKKLNEHALRLELKAVAPGANLDTHGYWQEALGKTALILRLLAGFILLLVLLSTGTVLVFATRSALAANRQILEVLSLIGATDNYISRQFTSHLVKLSFLACFIGLMLCVSLFYFSQNLLPINIPPPLYVGVVSVAIGMTIFSWSITHRYVLRILKVRS